MAVLAAAALLDELMGRNRNVLPNEKVKELNWEDSEYCKYYMVRFCPHDLFVNTKADLGSCPKVHDDEVKKLFEEAKGPRKLQYQEEFLRFCNAMMNEVERKIVKGKQRLALNQKTEGISLSPAQTLKNQEQITLLNERINGLEKEAEQAGIDGNVEQAQGLMKLCDQLKDERETLKTQNENSQWSLTAELAAVQEKQMEVCQVCGAFLIVGDAQQRIDDHLMGKQHVGYSKLRTAIEEITAIVQAAKEERRTRDEKRDRRKERASSEREKHRRGSSHDRDRDRSEHRSNKEKERSSDGGRDRREKERREKEKDRKERERERDRAREREREHERDRRHRDNHRGAGHRSFRHSHSHHRR